MKEAIIWTAIYSGMILAILALVIVLYGLFTEED